MNAAQALWQTVDGQAAVAVGLVPSSDAWGHDAQAQTLCESAGRAASALVECYTPAGLQGRACLFSKRLDDLGGGTRRGQAGTRAEGEAHRQTIRTRGDLDSGSSRECGGRLLSLTGSSDGRLDIAALTIVHCVSRRTAQRPPAIIVRFIPSPPSSPSHTHALLTPHIAAILLSSPHPLPPLHLLLIPVPITAHLIRKQLQLESTLSLD